MTPNRRHFLRTAGAVTAFSIAGCSDSPTGQTEQPDTGTPTETFTEVTPESDESTEYEQVGEIELPTFTREYAPVRFEATNFIKDQWERLGVSVNISPTPLSTITDTWTSHDFDALMFYWDARPERLDPSTFLNSFLSDRASEGGVNASEFTNDEYDQVVAQANETLNREERQQLVYRAQEILAEQQPAIWLFHRDALAAYNNTLFENWTAIVGNNPFWNARTLMDLTPTTDDGTAIWANTKPISTLNPMGAQSTEDLWAQKLFYGRLIRMGPDGQPQGWAASDWTVVDDTTIEVTLRDGMTFHDGESVTAEDVQFTFEYLAEWQQPYFESYYNPVESVETDGSDTVRFNLSSPNAPFINTTLSQVFILPKHVWDGVAEDQGLEHPRNWSEPVRTGSGPFKLTTYEPQSRIIYELHDGHPMADQFDVEQVIWNIYGAKSTAMGDTMDGRAAFVEQLQPTQFRRANNNSNLEAINSPSFGWTGIYLQTSRQPFGDLTFRRALAHATDQERIINITLRGYADAASSVIAPANQFWHNPDAPVYNGGLARAKELLAEAGYRWDDQGNLLQPME